VDVSDEIAAPTRFEVWGESRKMGDLSLASRELLITVDGVIESRFPRVSQPAVERTLAGRLQQRGQTFESNRLRFFQFYVRRRMSGPSWRQVS
jgi:hypothetical protein